MIEIARRYALITAAAPYAERLLECALLQIRALAENSTGLSSKSGKAPEINCKSAAWLSALMFSAHSSKAGSCQLQAGRLE